MIWANSVLPVFMAVFEPKLGILLERRFRIQIGDTPRRQQTLVTHGLQRFTIQFNRTAVWGCISFKSVLTSVYDVFGLMDTVDYDEDLAVERLLGLDVAELLSKASGEVLMSILDRELGNDSASLLIEQLSRGGRLGGASSGEDFQKMRSLLASFRIGLGEK